VGQLDAYLRVDELDRSMRPERLDGLGDLPLPHGPGLEPAVIEGVVLRGDGQRHRLRFHHREDGRPPVERGLQGGERRVGADVQTVEPLRGEVGPQGDRRDDDGGEDVPEHRSTSTAVPSATVS